MMDELKPCPFCGCDNVKMFYDERQNYHVECYGCGKTVSFHIAKNSSWEKAIEIYNRRAVPENKPLTVEELRKMDGEPVWCEIPQDNPQYGIVKAAHESIWLPAGALQFKYYGEWKAYAYKPEGSEPNG